MQQLYESGRTVLGRYVIERLMGQGGMGAVYVARHAELARKKFAIKTLRPDLFGYGNVDERFRREADVLAALDHPGIVSIVDYGMDGQTPVMVMELLQGETVRERIARTGPFPLLEVVRLVREVASALDFTHRCDPPVIHRDLKPENLFFVQPDARLKVLDFGIAKVHGSEANLTQGSTALGTPHYMSPEQLRDASKVDSTTDTFALASIAYECLAGTLAFPGEGIGGVVLAIFDAERPRATRARRDVPPAVDAVLARAWSIDRTQRYQTAMEFANAFAAAAGVAVPASAGAGMPIEMHPQTRIPITQRGGTPGGPAPISGGYAVPNRTNPSPAGTAANSAKLPLILGASIAALAVTAGLILAFTRADAPPPSPQPQAVQQQPQVQMRPLEPVLARPGNDGTNDPTAPANGRTNGMTVMAPGAAGSDVFETARGNLESPIRACAAGSMPGRRLGVRITWGGELGYPSNIALETNVTTRMRECISRAVMTYARIPPQTTRTVSRRYTFPL